MNRCSAFELKVAKLIDEYEGATGDSVYYIDVERETQLGFLPSETTRNSLVVTVKRKKD